MMLVGNYKVRRGCGFEWHYVHATFCENPSVGLGGISRDQYTDGCKKSIFPYKIREEGG